MEKADLAGGVAIALFGILMIFVVIPLDTEEGRYYGLPPTFFPTLLCIGVTGCAVALAGRAWLRLRAGGAQRPLPIRPRDLQMFAISSGLVIAGAVLVDFAGIVVGGPLLIAAFMLFLGERNVLRIALTATLPVGAVYLLARHVLHAPLP